MLVGDFYVPPVIFNVKRIRNEDGEEVFFRTSVDGKQRLTSLKRFTKGEIPCIDKNNKRWYYVNKDSLHKKPLLPQHVKNEFDNKVRI